MKFIPNSVSTRFARTALHTSKVSPQILFVGGIVGVGATVVLACRATLKIEDILDEHEKKMLQIEEFVSNPTLMSSDYSVSDARKDSIQLHVKTAVSIGKLYGPAIIVGAVSVSALAGSHNILSKRNAALTAAYGTVAKAFDDYRARVRDSLGDEREREIYHDVLPCEIDDPVTGKTTKRKVANGTSPYARLFDRNNVNWESPASNDFFLRMQQEYANNRLQAKGHLFLNEIYDVLGFERSKEGAVVGWVVDGGDNYVDFGIFNDRMSEQVVDFMVGRENAIWLDFNVDGVIYDKI